MKGLQRGIVLFALLADAHSWIEQMQVIGPNGLYIGDHGYPRGYVDRGNARFDGSSNTYMLPPPGSGRLRINASDLLCHPAQRTSNYSSDYPPLAASPGDWIVLKYLENGHVTQPWAQIGKPSGAGTVFVYGTYDPDPQQKILDVLQWTRDGAGGDGTGWLMAAQNFDDRRCHQISNSAISLFRQQSHPNRVSEQSSSQAEQWCETDVRIHAQARQTNLTLYWIWQWPTAEGGISLPAGKDEYYTSCMDVRIRNGTSASTASARSVSLPSLLHGLAQQDPQTRAVSDYANRTALVSSPVVHTAGEMPKLAASPTASTVYSLDGATLTTSGSTYVLEPQGTALRINGKLAAYINRNGSVTTGPALPMCSAPTHAVADHESSAASSAGVAMTTTMLFMTTGTGARPFTATRVMTLLTARSATATSAAVLMTAADASTTTEVL